MRWAGAPAGRQLLLTLLRDIPQRKLSGETKFFGVIIVNAPIINFCTERC